MLDQDEQNLSTLTSLVDKKKNVLSLAEKKIKQLEKQLEATKRIYQTNVEQIGNLNEKVSNTFYIFYRLSIAVSNMQKTNW